MSFSKTVGDEIALALAASGERQIIVGCGHVCGTDILAAKGCVFPQVPLERLHEFNRKTLFEGMTEADECRRYAKIEEFFRGQK